MNTLTDSDVDILDSGRLVPRITQGDEAFNRKRALDEKEEAIPAGRVWRTGLDEEEAIPRGRVRRTGPSDLKAKVLQLSKALSMPATTCDLCQDFQHNNMPTCRQCNKHICYGCLASHDPKPGERVDLTGRLVTKGTSFCPFCRDSGGKPHAWTELPAGAKDPRERRYTCHNGCGFEFVLIDDLDATTCTFTPSPTNNEAALQIMVNHRRFCPNQRIVGKLIDILSATDSGVAEITNSLRREVSTANDRVAELEAQLQQFNEDAQYSQDY